MVTVCPAPQSVSASRCTRLSNVTSAYSAIATRRPAGGLPDRSRGSLPSDGVQLAGDVDDEPLLHEAQVVAVDEGSPTDGGQRVQSVRVRRPGSRADRAHRSFGEGPRGEDLDLVHDDRTTVEGRVVLARPEELAVDDVRSPARSSRAGVRLDRIG